MKSPSPVQHVCDRLAELPDNVRADETTVETLRNEVKAQQEAVQLARTVANFRRGRHELELGPTLIDTPLGERQASRTAARLLSADAAMRAHDGDPDGASRLVPRHHRSGPIGWR